MTAISCCSQLTWRSLPDHNVLLAVSAFTSGHPEVKSFCDHETSDRMRFPRSHEPSTGDRRLICFCATSPSPNMSSCHLCISNSVSPTPPPLREKNAGHPGIAAFLLSNRYLIQDDWLLPSNRSSVSQRDKLVSLSKPVLLWIWNVPSGLHLMLSPQLFWRLGSSNLKLPLQPNKLHQPPSLHHVRWNPLNGLSKETGGKNDWVNGWELRNTAAEMNT